MKWKFVGESFIGTDEEDTQTIAYLSDHRNRKPRSDEETKFNGNLIAAAPELLAILEDIAEDIVQDDHYLRAKTLIDKIKGEKETMPFQANDIVTYNGPKTEQFYPGQPSVILAFVDNKAALIRTNWFEISYWPEQITEKINALMSDIDVAVIMLEKYFQKEPGPFTGKFNGKYPELKENHDAE